VNDPALLADRGRVEIGECCLDTDADIALDDASASLDQGERARAARFVFVRDRERFIRAHGYLRRRLGAFLAVAPGDVPIAAPDGQKPFVEGGGASFSLSHSGPRAVVAVTDGDDIGIDLEMVDRSERFADQLDDLARFCLTIDEQHALAAFPQGRRIGAFLSYWTAKEARMKLTGEGMSLAPRSIALRLLDGRPVGYARPAVTPAALQFVPLSVPDAICCLASHRAGGQAVTPARG
jgi:4'-phosphopantetheinyl transferase